MCNDFYGLSAPFDYIDFAVNGKVWMAVVTTTDRLKSVRNRCIIEVFGGVFVLSLYFLESVMAIRDFVIGMSQITSLCSSIIDLIYCTYLGRLWPWLSVCEIKVTV